MFVLIATIGLARFGLGSIAPLMATDLKLSSLQVGMLSSAQNVSYLLFAWVGGRSVRKFGAGKQIIVSLSLCGVGVIFTGLLSNFILLLLTQAFVGICSGFATMAGYGLVFANFGQRDMGRAVGAVNTAPGIGLLLTGFVGPVFSGYAPNLGWRLAWYTFGGVTIAIALASAILLMRDKSGLSDGIAPIVTDVIVPRSKDIIMRNKKLIFVGLLYFIFGTDYIIYVIFFPSYVTFQLGLGTAIAGNAIIIAGICASTSGVFLGTLSDRIGRMKTMSIAYFFLAMSSLVALSVTSLNGVYASAILFGFFSMGLPAVIIVMAQSLSSATVAAEAVGFVTIFHGTGQAVGPTVAGYLSTAQKYYSPDFVMMLILSFAGAALALVGALRIESRIHSALEKKS